MAYSEDQELIELFIEESGEHLDGIEADFLEIEKQGKAVDPERINKVFRAIHSIKGGAAFLGFETIKNLSHSMEDILNRMRNGTLLPDSKLIGTLLTSVDVLKDLIQNYASSERMDISEPLKTLQIFSSDPQGTTSLTSEGSKIEIRLPDGKVLFNISRQELAAAKTGGRFVYVTLFDWLEDLDKKDRTAGDVIEEVEAAGMYLNSKIELSSLPDLQHLDDLPAVPFYVLYATVLEPNFIPTLVKVDTSQTYQLTDNNSLKCIGRPDSVDGYSPEKKEKQEQKRSDAHDEGKGPSVPSEEKNYSQNPRVGRKEPNISFKSSSLRVSVHLLDRLMNLAGELVLTRNQLLQEYSSVPDSNLTYTIHQINLLTSELQEAIIATRMQPIGVIFSKFHRLVHDMAKEAGKEVELVIEGDDVELDKTIIEAIADPLTHLIRNALDHGIETPQKRKQAGKKLPAVIRLHAYHEAGQMNIEITDDGAGIDPEKIKRKILEMGLAEKAALETMPESELMRFIFRPGFSTAEKVTAISGRGVGMDVVHSNLSKIGGSVDMESTVGMGTTIHIKLPLTLAIIPSLIVRVASERYAIPQINVAELVRIPAKEVQKRIQRIDHSALLRLRGELLPLIRISDVLNIHRIFIDPETGEQKTDRRKTFIDRRSKDIKNSAAGHESMKRNEKSRERADRRISPGSAYTIVVVNAGELNYGLLVDELIDYEEIVVKPLGRHINRLPTYAGATLLGDGKAALILDVIGMGMVMKMKVVKKKVEETILPKKQERPEDTQSMLLVHNAENEQFAVPLGLISRIEKIDKSEIEITGGKKTIRYRGKSLILCSIEDVAKVKPIADLNTFFVIVFPYGDKEVGLLVSRIIDVVDFDMKMDEESFRQSGILGSAVINNQTTLLLDLYDIVSQLLPEWTRDSESDAENTVLLVEDSRFFRRQIRGFLEQAGYTVLTAKDGLEGAELLESSVHPIRLILTDIEMPNLDGVSMTEKIRRQHRFDELPIIALTTVIGKSAEQRARKAGMDEYLIKLNREHILERVQHFIRNGRSLQG